MMTDIARSGNRKQKVTPMTPNEFRAFVQAHDWVWAKTYAKTHPHYYLVRKGCRDDLEWQRAVRTTRLMGYDEYFYRRKMRYLDLDGDRFWTMAYEESGEDILNRASNEGEPDTPWDRNPKPLFIRDPVKEGYPKHAERAGNNPYLVKGMKDLDRIIKSKGNLTKLFSTLKPLVHTPLGHERLERVIAYFHYKDKGLAKGVKEDRPPRDDFIVEGTSYYNWFTRSLKDDAYYDMVDNGIGKSTLAVMPNECVIESIGTAGDTSSIIRLKKEPDIVKRDLREVGISLKDTFINMKLLSSYYHWIHSPVSGVVEGITPVDKKDGLFGRSALWVLRINSEALGVVTMLIVGEAVVQDFKFYLKEGETIKIGEEIGHFSWGSQTVLFLDAKGRDLLVGKRRYYFVGEPIL